MTQSPLVRWRRVTERAGPLVASSLVHVLVFAVILAVGVGSAPRWRPAVEAELIVLARDVLPREPPPAPREPPPPPPVVTRPPTVVERPTPPRVSPPPPAPRPVETPPIKEEVVPPAREEVKVVAPPPKPEPPAAPAPRGDETKSLAPAEPARPAGGQDGSAATPDTRPSGGSPFGAPAPGGTERAGSGRGGSAPTGQGGPGSPSSGTGGTGVASLPGNAGSTGGSGITRSAMPRGGYQVLPVYPTSARQAGIQGTSLLRVHVAADGRVTDIVVTRSAGHVDMDEAAMAAVRQWRFEPGRRGHEAVGMWVVLPVEFRIK